MEPVTAQFEELGAEKVQRTASPEPQEGNSVNVTQNVVVIVSSEGASGHSDATVGTDDARPITHKKEDESNKSIPSRKMSRGVSSAPPEDSGENEGLFDAEDSEEEGSGVVVTPGSEAPKGDEKAPEGEKKDEEAKKDDKDDKGDKEPEKKDEKETKDEDDGSDAGEMKDGDDDDSSP